MIVGYLVQPTGPELPQWGLTSHSALLHVRKPREGKARDSGTPIGNYPQQGGSGKPPGGEAEAGLYSLRGDGNQRSAGKWLTTGSPGEKT